MESIEVFQKVRIRIFNRWGFRKGAAAFIPGLGIIVGRAFADDRNLLRHEFGHFLQFKKWGAWVFFRHVALDSLLSCRKSQKKKNVWFRHSDTWTEWSANVLFWEYFGRPNDWDTCKYPLKQRGRRAGSSFPPSLKFLEKGLPTLFS